MASLSVVGVVGLLAVAGWASQGERPNAIQGTARRTQVVGPGGRAYGEPSPRGGTTCQVRRVAEARATRLRGRCSARPRSRAGRPGPRSRRRSARTAAAEPGAVPAARPVGPERAGDRGVTRSLRSRGPARRPGPPLPPGCSPTLEQARAGLAALRSQATAPPQGRSLRRWTQRAARPPLRLGWSWTSPYSRARRRASRAGRSTPSASRWISRRRASRSARPSSSATSTSCATSRSSSRRSTRRTPGNVQRASSGGAAAGDGGRRRVQGRPWRLLPAVVHRAFVVRSDVHEGGLGVAGCSQAGARQGSGRLLRAGRRLLRQAVLQPPDGPVDRRRGLDRGHLDRHLRLDRVRRGRGGTFFEDRERGRRPRERGSRASPVAKPTQFDSTWVKISQAEMEEYF